MHIISEKGPVAEKEYHPIHTLSEFIDKFGELSYADNKQTALVIYNWLSNGGTLFPYRLQAVEKANLVKYYAQIKNGNLGDKVELESVYYGEYYNKLKVKLTAISKHGEYVKKVKLDINYRESENVPAVNVYSRNFDSLDYEKALNDNGFIRIKDSLTFEKIARLFKDVSVVELATEKAVYTKIELVELLKAFWTDEGEKFEAYETLANNLEAPVDVIMDAGYPAEVKNLMINFIDNEEGSGAVRTDIVGLFDLYSIYEADGLTNVEEALKENRGEHDGLYRHTNVAVWDQYFTVNNALFDGRDIKVTPTYFLSKLLPYNDLTYGIQYPIAGLRRGILDDALAIFTNPSPDMKQQLFESRINYVEKSSREYAFMSQRTWDGSTDDRYTSLSFLNNVRALEKMKKELYRLGREYLFEYNDAVTLSQMNNVLNRYMANWVANRTLSYADVIVSQNEYSTEAVDVRLTVRFNNTIEVISVDITIE